MLSSTFVFIDAAIENYQLLASGVSKAATVVVIDAAQDGIAQVSAAIAAQSVDSVHIFSHGAPGTLQLGSSCLSLDTIDAYDLQPWQQALKNANLLIYGCRVAAGESGDRFLQTLHERTGANIAATATPTGSAAKGGDWHLERSIGAVDRSAVLRSDVMAQYEGVLAFVIPNLLFAVSTTDEANTALPSQLRVVDINTGNSQIVGTLAFQTFALARQATTGRLYYIETGQNGRVAYFDLNNQQNVELPNRTGIFDVDPATPPSQFVKLAQAQNGSVYGMNSSTAELFRIDIDGANAGVAQNLGNILLPGGVVLPFGGGDIAFDPTNPNRLFVTVARSDSDTINFFKLYSVDISGAGSGTLLATEVGDVRLPNGTVLNDLGSGSLAFGQDGFLYLTSDFDGIRGTDDSRLFQVNQNTGIVINAEVIRPIARLNDFATLPTITPQVNLILTKSDGLQSIAPGEEITYTITVTNSSPTGDLADIRLTDFTTGLNGVTWSGQFTGGVPGSINGFLPGAQSGSGNIDVLFNLGAQATLTYTLRGTVDPNSAIGSVLSNTAEIIVPPGVIDPNPEDNTDTDSTEIDTITRPDAPGDEDEDNCVPGINRRGNNRDNRLLGDNDINRLEGRGGNDLLRGFSCPDTLLGGLGRDTLRGGNSGDNLQGNQNNDRLSGGRGNDQLNGGLGNDVLLGGTGRDSLRGGSGRDRMLGEAGGDRLVGNDGDDFLRGGSEDDVIFGRVDNDRLIGNRGDDVLRGNIGRDRLGGGPGNDLLDGGRGNDLVYGGNGNDQLVGRLGTDRLIGGSGDDFVDGQAQADRLKGNGGRDRLLGKGGADLIAGGTQADFLNGGKGFDRLFGDGGNDRLLGGLLADRLTGGAGRDRFEYRSTQEGGDRIFDFSTATDLIDLSRIFAGSAYSSSNPFRRYIRLEQSGSTTNVLLDLNGDRSGGFEQFIALSNVRASSLSARSFIV